MSIGRNVRARRASRAATGLLLAVVTTSAAWRATDFHAPPRYDGAGYAVLAAALSEGQGYREVDHPDAPRHAHFPPGYPLALAAVWSVTGRSAVAAHLFSLACTVLAVLVSWLWFRTAERNTTAVLLALALALNWTWDRTAGAIQSEPLFLLLGQTAILTTATLARRCGARAGGLLGLLLGACVVTRHVGLALAAAVVLELLLRRRFAAALAASATCALVIAPWAAWLLTVREHTQVALVGRGGGVVPLVANQALFYTQRLPDLLTGPFVEIATVFGRSRTVALAASLWALAATALLAAGGVWSLRSPRRRLAALVSVTTLGLLLVWPFTEAGRFLIPLLPCMLLLETEGLSLLLRRMRSPRRRARSAAAWLLLGATLPYSAYALATDRAGAQRRTHEAFDRACVWIAREGTVPGPVLSRHPGEVYWQTGRKALPAGSVEEAVDRYRVAYLLVDEERYANAPSNPLAAYVEAHPGRVREVWREGDGRSSVAVYAVEPGRVRDGAPRR